MKKPHIFIASSAEALSVATSIQGLLEYDAECTVWNQGVFGREKYPLMDLIKQAQCNDFGIFVFSYDDAVIKRNSKTSSVRDNVIFELGLFIGSIGIERCFIVEPKTNGRKRTLPSDLAGINPLTYDSNREDKNIIAALGTAVSTIKEQISKWNTEGVIRPTESLMEQISKAGISAFYRDREDYRVFRSGAPSVDKYIERAKQSIVITGISLGTGIHDDAIDKVIKQKIEENKAFTVTISLLNPDRNDLYSALDTSRSADPNTLQTWTKDALQKLKSVKESIDIKKQKNLSIRVHNILPPASAIILDGNTDEGTIQLETKPYKNGSNKSFGFEIRNDGANAFYKRLVDSYMELINDGEEWKG